MGPDPNLLSIPPHVAFVDALAQGLLARCAGDPLALARAHVLLPNRRAARALTEAFVRQSGGGLLLPAMTPVGDLGDDSFDRFASGDAAIAPAVSLLIRRLELARLVRALPDSQGRTAVEALRLGDDLGRTLDALLAEEIPPEALRAAVKDADLAEHWATTLAFLDLVITAWPPARDATGGSDAGTRVAALIDALIARWQLAPPPGLIVAAGITGSSPPLVRLLAAITDLPGGLVVLPGLDTDMSPAGTARWAAIHCGDPDCRDSEEHPQFALKTLLAKLGRDRAEVADWGVTTPRDGPADRAAAVMAAMAPAGGTGAGGWQDSGNAFVGVTSVEAATPAEEAQVIALALRRALETPGRTAALVTPDRALARRVAAHCRRWQLMVDDSAGTPLRLTPPGALALALVEALAQGFSPTPLLAVLKHPLVAAGETRSDWLAAARQLDLALRGVRPPPGLDAIGEALDSWQATIRDRCRREAPAELVALVDRQAVQTRWWQDAAARLDPLARLADRPDLTLPGLAAALRLTGTALGGDGLWRGADGRALAGLIERLEADGTVFGAFDLADAPGLMAALLSDIAIRPAYGGHPRLAILGPLEAQLQRADLMILGGLNEGIWPGRPAPDPWLAPAIRKALALPGTARDIGLAAHDFVGGLGAGQVLITRARRDASAPLVPSRFWLRLQAFSGGIRSDHELLDLARRLDGRGQGRARPAPSPAPPAIARPRTLSVTEVDTLIADPFAFYARNILSLRRLDPLDDDPTAQTRGNRIHKVMERWIGSGGGSLQRLMTIAEEEIAAEARQFPLLRALWAPRARRALAWAGQAVHDREADGWTSMFAEAGGELLLANGITLKGRADRIDLHDDGRLAVIDYKTGAPPSPAQVAAGFANQLGLLMAMAASGNLRTRAARLRPGTPAELLYWQLGGGAVPGKIIDALKSRPPVTAVDHVDAVLDRTERLTTALLLGTAAFEPKLHPGFAWGDYDHLARVAEWLDRPLAGAAR
jgi:ATP-dependent helicase/nuclease subunit B